MTAPVLSARAPGKLILSGEHSVTYGAPALALAVQRYARAYLSVSTQPGVEIILANLGIRRFLTWAEMQLHYGQSKHRYQQFLQSDLSIDAVLQDPSSLYFYALSELQQQYPLCIPSAIQIRLDSELPIGAGMGSSAATVAALLLAVSSHWQLPLDQAELTQLTQKTELLQHGRSSGLDPTLCCQGGVRRFQDMQSTQLNLVDLKHWYCLDTGKPSVSTGQCVAKVRENFVDSNIWQDFAAVTLQLQSALEQQDQAETLAAVRRNHQLLCEIQLVPEPVRQWITALELQGGAAKISGAGACAGDAAGMLLIYAPDVALPQTTPFGELIALNPDMQGACLE